MGMRGGMYCRSWGTVFGLKSMTNARELAAVGDIGFFLQGLDIALVL